jgi:hypothetical protein
MARWSFIVVAFLLLSWGGLESTSLSAPESTSLGAFECSDPAGKAEQHEWCGETSVQLCGYSAECLTGVCQLVFVGGGYPCDGDGSQCWCEEIDRR